MSGLDDEALFERLVRIPSPTGQEQEAVAFLQEQARADGLVVVDDEVGNFIAEAGGGDRVMLFVGHVDTVPGELPVGVLADELWGRGSVDAKGALAAAYCAARRFRDDERVRIVVVGAVDEEGMSRGVQGLPDRWAPDRIINGEPSGASGLTLGYKGIVRGSLTVERELGHGAGPQRGAADALVDAWLAVRGRFGFQASFDAVQGRLDDLRTRNDGIHEAATGGFQLRLPPGFKPQEAVDALEEVAARCGADLRVHEALPAVLAPRRTPLVAAFTSAIRKCGGTPRLLRKTGTSDMNRLARRWPGVPIAAYGPGDSALDHRPDERLSLHEYRQSVQVLSEVFSAFAAQADEAHATAPNPDVLA